MIPLGLRLAMQDKPTKLSCALRGMPVTGCGGIYLKQYPDLLTFGWLFDLHFISKFGAGD